MPVLLLSLSLKGLNPECALELTHLPTAPSTSFALSVRLTTERPSVTDRAACQRAKLVVVVLTLNEERHLPQCLESCQFAWRTVVIDAGSNDNTTKIAQQMGAQVHLHTPWEGFGVQRTRSLAYCQDADYIFFLDADECLTGAGRLEIEAIIDQGLKGAWLIAWEQVAFGRVLPSMKSAPGMPRLFSKDCLLGFEAVVHERALLAPGTTVGRLSARVPHYSYETVHGCLKKITQYAMLGAAKRAGSKKTGGVLRGLASAMALFMRLYFLHRGITGGAEGFLYCYIRAQECFFRYAALKYDSQALSGIVERVRS